MVKLIASDVDGTLLPDFVKTLSPHTSELISQLVDRGIVFVLASGRQYESLYNTFSNTSDNLYYLAENGAYCVYHNEPLFTQPWSKNEVERVIQEIKQRSDCHIMISGINSVYTDSRNKQFYEIIHDKLGYRTTIVDNLLTDIHEPIVKIAAWHLESTRFIESHFEALFHDDITIATAGPKVIDFVLPTINKGLGLQAILKHLNIDPADCVAFGDQTNDIPMLTLAGTSYAVSTCKPGVDAYANYICNSVDDILEEILTSIT